MNKSTYLLLALAGTLLSTSPVRSQEREDRIGMHGVALPMLQVIMRPTIPGQVSGIPVSEGQHVRKGEVLVQLDAREAVARQRVAELEARSTGILNNARAELEYAKSNFERIRDLFGENASNEREFEEARLRFRMAQAAIDIELERLAVAEARFQLATAELEQYTIVAPFDGIVSQVKVNQGQAVQEIDELLEIVSMDKLRVELFLPVEWTSRLPVGSQQTLQAAHPFSRSVKSTVTYQSRSIESTSGTIRFVFEIDNRNLELPAGISATLGHLPQQVSTASVSVSAE